MIKKIITNTILALVSVVLTLILSEFIFQKVLFSNLPVFKSLRVPSYYSDHILHKNEDFFNDNFWKLHYLFNPEKAVGYLHPLLGWTGNFDSKTYKHNNTERLFGRRPVLLYGNSFTMCVDSVKCFEEILNKDTVFTNRHYLLNYGVGGYGLDQISLLMQESAKTYEKPFIVFGMLTTDLDRCLLSFRLAPKPYFEISSDQLMLKGAPLNLTIEEYVDQHPPEIQSYLWNRFKSSPLNPITPDRNLELEYIEEIKVVNNAILDSAVQILNSYEVDYVFLIFQPEYHSSDDWRLAFLRSYFEERKLPYICDVNLRPSDKTIKNYDPALYSIPGDGHPTTYLNRLVAEKLKDYILTTDSAKDLFSYNRKLAMYKQAIRNTPKWLENVESDAIKEGVPIDTIMERNARYMIYAEHKKD